MMNRTTPYDPTNYDKPAVVVSTAPQIVELETTGQVTVGLAANECNRCGPVGTTRTLSWRCVLTSCPDLLTEQGFIVDWQDIHAYWKATYEQDVDVFPSCESIAARAVSDIVGLLGSRCIGVDVHLGSGDMPTGMRASWRSPEYAERLGGVA